MIKNVETLLGDIRQAVMQGDYAQLAPLLEALEHAEAQIPTNDVTGLKRLKTEAERTATCLQSALSGVRATRRRVSEISEAARGLTIYDREGLKATVLNAHPTSRRV